MPTVIPMFEPRGNTIAELLMRQGDVQARAALMRSDALSRGIEGVGQAVAQGVQAWGQQKDQKKREQMLDAAMMEFDPADPRAFYRKAAVAVGPESAARLMTGLASMMRVGQGEPPNPADLKSVLGSLSAARKVYGDDGLAQRWGMMAPLLKKYEPLLGVPVPDQYTPESGDWIDGTLATMTEKKDEGALVETLDAAGNRVKRRATPEELRVGVPVPPSDESALVDTVDAAGNRVRRRATAEELRAGVPVPPPQRDPVAAELAALRLDEARKNAEARRASADALRALGAGWEPLIGRATASMPAARRDAWRETFARAAASGDTEELASQVRQAAVEGENVDVKNQVVGREATIASLEDTRAILNEMKAKGVPTNWISGSMENLARRLGQTTNPEYVALGNRLMGTLINYRRAATGVQFSARESADYERMFPNYKNLNTVNLALIDGLLREMKTYDKVYWERKLGKDGARLVGAVKDESGAPSSPTPIKIKSIKLVNP